MLRVRGNSIMSRVICNVSYTGPKSGGQSAGRLGRYLEYRQQEDGRYERQELYGDREEFREAARERAEEERVSYTHTVISPERGEEYADRDLEQLMDEWTRDRAGEQQPFIAAIHRDSDHPHVHIATARDKFDRDELADKKEIIYELAHDREKIMDLRREYEPERDHDREREPDRSRGQDREGDRGEDQDRDRGGQDREQDRDQGMEMER